MNVLLVEDDDHVRWVIEEMLLKMGHHPSPVDSASQALTLLQSHPQHPFDCVILDRNMPGLSGIDMLKALRKNPLLAELPVVMLTGSTTAEAMAEGLANGAQLYLAKPASYDILRAALNSIREQALQREQLISALSTTRQGLLMAESMEFQFRTPSQATQLAALLANLANDPEESVIGLSELLINAVEHGNLGIGYDEKSRLLENESLHAEIERRLADPVLGAKVARVRVSKAKNRFCLTIEDQGNGFDWQPYLDFSQERAFDLHGRGIAMANHSGLLNLTYLGQGNVVRVWVNSDRSGSEASRTTEEPFSKSALEPLNA